MSLAGEGYGSVLMADVARPVIGVDISGEAVQHASSIYNKPNLAFRQGSATRLDFADTGGLKSEVQHFACEWLFVFTAMQLFLPLFHLFGQKQLNEF